MSRNDSLSYIWVGQANMHKSTDCAAALANHIYLQMRSMDVVSPGNSLDRCQTLKPNPRRAGLPRTVTEWKERRGTQSSAQNNEDHPLASLPEDDESSSPGTTRQEDVIPGPSTRSCVSGLRMRATSSRKAATSLSQDPDPLSPNSTHPKSTFPPSLTLSNQAYQSSTAKPAEDRTCSIDLGQAKPTGWKKGTPPEAFIFALQEPGVWGKSIVNIKNAIQIMDLKCLGGRKPVNPRAAIICSNHLNMWPMADLCSRDMAVGLLKGSNLGDIYVVSLYCDGERKKAVPPEYKHFLKIAKQEHKQVITLMDSNSHSETLWQSKKTCSRGREWENFLTKTRYLAPMNTGDNFTFMSKKGQSIIDVTLATSPLADRISQWGVVDSVPNSDHLSIEMLLQMEGVWTRPPRTWNFNSKAFQKERFTEEMENSSTVAEQARYWDPAILDRQAQSFVDDMVQALDITAPSTSRSTNIAKAGWFDAECKRMLRRCKQIRQYIRNWTRRRRRKGLPDFESNRMRFNWSDYIDCRRAFRRRCRRVKRKHFRRFIADIRDPTVIARLSKRLDKNASAQLCCFKDPTGKKCTPAETVQQLKDTHFPKCTDRPPDRPRTFMSNGVADIKDEKADFINASSVRICISSFKSHKAPGPDRLKMYPFKLLGPKALERLVNIYKASYLLGAMPECFKLVQIIFIPKIDKPAYDVPNAHRPIALMNNIMKIEEKLFLWRQEDTNLLVTPLEQEQHGFVKAKSCDSAITVLVSHVEHALMRDWFGAVAFLDFQGAYDNLQYSSMEQALIQMGTDAHLISWYKDFFYHRKSQIHIKGISTEIYHTQGAPQGGIGSPYLWAATLNELIKLIKTLEEVKIIAYADDLCLVVIGPNKDHCIQILQTAVNAVMSWAKRHLLALSPTKSETILFTKKRGYPTILETAAKIQINGRSINYAHGAVRYLGIWLDRKLNWTEHIKIKTKKVRGLLFKLAGISGDLWGYKPIIGKYCWEGLARPVLSYGCLGWIPALMKKKTVDTQLTAIQRHGYRLMAFFRRSTPNKGLDMIFNIMPIKYHLLKTAAKSYIRTVPVAPYQWEEMHTDVTARVSHRTWIEEFIGDANLSYLKDPLDFVPLHRKWDKTFLVDMTSMSKSSAKAGKPLFSATLDAYTDGSQEKNPEQGPVRTGAGVAFMRGKKMLIVGKQWAAYKYKLHAKNTVMQAELFAIKKCCEIILNHTQEQADCWVTTDDTIDIYCDSQAAVLALNSIFVQSELAEQVLDLLNEVASKIRCLTIRWIRGHQRHTGNDRADLMARAGRDSQGPPESDAPKIAKAVMKSEIELATRQLWKTMWNIEPTCRQSKDWFPNGPRPRFAFEILHLPRPLCSQVIHFVTGHNFLKRHQALVDMAIFTKAAEEEDLMGNAEEPLEPPCSNCSLCGQDEETSYHIMTECVILTQIRIAVFGKEEILPPYDNIPLYKLISYLKDVKLKSLEMRPFIEEFMANELPVRMPEWARINDVEDSSDDELQADQRYAKECGDALLHRLLYQTSN